MIQIMITPDGIVRINVEKEADINALRIAGHIEDAKEEPVTPKVSKTVARKRGSRRKRPVFLTSVQAQQLVHDHVGGGMSVNTVAKRYGVSASTAWKYISEANKKVNITDKEEDVSES